MAAKRSKPSPGGWRPGKEPINLYRDDLREALGRCGKALAAMRPVLNEHGAGILSSRVMAGFSSIEINRGRAGDDC